ncbi:MAG: hypothetical protein JWN98_1358 [Abditibacteriota bacterium]|nr:hypothetical protein [Abditibacteriota bacterium]
MQLTFRTTRISPSRQREGNARGWNPRGGFWLAAMCALLLASSGASGVQARDGFALPRLTPQSAQHYAAMLWWLQQQTAAGVKGVPNTASLTTALCERRDDPTHDVLRLVAILQSSHNDSARSSTRTPVQSSQAMRDVAAQDSAKAPAKVTRAVFWDEPLDQMATPWTLVPSSPRFQRVDDSRRLQARSLAPHEALMRSGTSFCRFLE